MIDPEQVVLAIASGRKVAEVAQDLGLTESAVNAVLDQEAKHLFDAERMQKDILLEAARLAAVGKKYFGIAMADRGEASAAAAVIYCKLSERLSTMLGRNSPIGHAVQLIGASASPQRKTSTQELRTLLDNICHITPRERQLIDLEDEQGYDAERRAEINVLRAERAKPPLEPFDDPSKN